AGPVQVHRQIKNRGPAGLGPFHGAAQQLGLEQFMDHGPDLRFFHGPPGQVRPGLNRFRRGPLREGVRGHLLPDHGGLQLHRLLVEFDRVVPGVVLVHQPGGDRGSRRDEPRVGGGPYPGDGGDAGLSEQASGSEAGPGQGGAPLFREADEGELARGDGGGELDGGRAGAVLPFGDEGGAGDDAGHGEAGGEIGGGDLHWRAPAERGPPPGDGGGRGGG